MDIPISNGERPVAPLLSLHGVSRRFMSAAGKVSVLEGVDLTVAAGDFVALTGPSGSGKTTLLNVASLLDRPCEGQVMFAGRDAGRLPSRALARLRGEKVGMVFQRFHLLTRRTALENVMFRFRYIGAGSDARARALRALDEVGLRDKASIPVRLLSGGEMQRVAIARAMVERPLIVFADEPTGNLDAAHSLSIMAIFERVSRAGVAVVVATHNRELAAHCSRHVRCTGGGLEEVPVRQGAGKGSLKAS